MNASYTFPKSYTTRLGINARKLGAYYWNEPVDSYEENGWAFKGAQRLFLLSGYAYLGLVKEQTIIDQAVSALQTFGLGAYASRIMGTVSLHEELEDLISETNLTENSILYPSGYQANIATISALAGPEDVIFSDTLNHASIIDGCKMSGARTVPYAHKDLTDLEDKLASASGYRNRFVVVDAVFSMDGDIAPIPEICQICRDYKAVLIVDEAHSFGVLGRRGYGVTEHFGLAPGDIDVITGVLSKAVPGAGGYASGSRELVTFLKENARGYIFSGASSPFHAAVSIASIKHMQANPSLVERLRDNTEFFHEELRRSGVNIGATTTPITPVIIGDAKKCVLASRAALEEGIHLFAIPFPVVPLGTSRLRASVSAGHKLDDLRWAAKTIARIAVGESVSALEPA